MSNASEADDVERLRLRYAFWLAIAGLGLAALLVIFLVVGTAITMQTAQDVVAIVGLFTSITGTLVGAFFGLQIGAAGKEREIQDRRTSQKMAEMALGMMEPEDAMKVMDKYG